ncbi:MAG: RDD family protein [Prochloron sp. SP5CPC1]|nr:RDD family protein [Candidatus Paraprochloron terpiosi SP5CPC1]
MYEYTNKPTRRRFPKVPYSRRIGAFAIDFTTVSLFSALGFAPFWLLFILGWLLLRVVVVERNKGQSLGRWALDMKAIDSRFNRVPGLVSLAKREGIVGFAALLGAIGLSINFHNGMTMLLLISPLLADCGVAFTDEELNQALHDRIGETIVVQTRRGFSLDLRLKRLWGKFHAEAQRRGEGEEVD